MSKIEVDAIDKQSGSTLTLGGSGTAVTLACGATQTGFGRTGTVDWVTSVKTNSDSPLTVASGKGYFLNTTSGTITVNLPAGSAGDIVAFKDYANTWDSNAVTVVPNGSDKINGINDSASLETESQSVTLIFIDSTKGWLDIHDSTSDITGSTFITATGGTITTVCTNFKVHTFTSPGTFCVSAGQGPKAKVDYLVIAGGGGSVHDRGGGGGAGGYREAKTGCNGSYSASPLATSEGILLSPGPYSITVGGGGAADNAPPYNPGLGGTGNNSVFSTITSAGGGGGNRASPQNGGPGGSGGGAGINPAVSPEAGTGGSGNTPPVSPPQGSNGGDSATSPNRTGGGGGATAVGQNGSGPKAGGAGATSSINGTPTTRAGGGGGIASGAGGAGGGGTGSPDCSGPPGGNGTANTGGGGGGGGSNVDGGSGGSGIVVIRYKFQ
jgi:hypothetical protein